MIIKNPKRSSNDQGKVNWYPYYAGFSSEFVNSIIRSAKLKKNACIADPWNGGGTTTIVANALGYNTKGVDLNPVMVLAAKACFVRRMDIPSLIPVAHDIIDKSLAFIEYESANDPLHTWIQPKCALDIRKLEIALQKLLINHERNPVTYLMDLNTEDVSPIACFFYVAIFRFIRKILKPFYSTNPTWIKKPKRAEDQIAPDRQIITSGFLEEVICMIEEISNASELDITSSARTELITASSEALPWLGESVDMVVTSPPYCTRIDYAVATMPELAILGYDLGSSFDTLRRKLIGTSTVPKLELDKQDNWGKTCINFLDKLYAHESVSSKSYYYKSHLQYFNSIDNSFKEIQRVLVSEGRCSIVVQDSFYKNIKNDLPKIYIEMAQNYNLNLEKRKDFLLNTTMAGINPSVKKYRTDFKAVESVLCFKKS